jgi:hypothetical protein
MVRQMKFLMAVSLLAASYVSCHKSKHHVSTPPSTDKPLPPEILALTVPEADYAKSKYCGDTIPEKAEDPTPPHYFDVPFLDKKLESDDGLVGWIHGAVPRYKQYLFTYRLEDANDPMAFFKAEQFSLSGATPEIWAEFASLKRHDKVSLKGKVLGNRSPLKHLVITSVKVIKKYDKPTENPYSFDASKLGDVTSFNVFGQVHAVVSSEDAGYAMVIERDNFMMPVAVSTQHDEIAKKLYKGDIVSVDIKVVRGSDGRPPHFETDGDKPNALKIVDPLVNCHGVHRGVTGHLVKFDKSPAISTDVYAVRIVDGNGIARNMTLFPGVSAEDPKFYEIFMAVKTKAEKAWNDSLEAPSVVRNYNEKKSIKVTVRGKINVLSTEQANAQVYIMSADDVDFK